MSSYPTMEAVEAAGAEQLLRWNRFLPSPRSVDEVPVISRVVARLGEERTRLDAEEPGEWPRISKRVGLG